MARIKKIETPGDVISDPITETPAANDDDIHPTPKPKANGKTPEVFFTERSGDWVLVPKLGWQYYPEVK